MLRCRQFNDTEHDLYLCNFRELNAVQTTGAIMREKSKLQQNKLQAMYNQAE